MHVLAVIILATGMITGCSSSRPLFFANRDWHVSDYYGQIIDRDTVYRLTFGNGLIPKSLTIISSADSAARYPGMERFIADILHTACLDSAEILFYAPHMMTMFVVPKRVAAPARPSSISVKMTEERPYTMWTVYDDAEDWTRTPEEMYTYTYYNSRKKQLLFVDMYDYGNTPIAQITVFQSRNKATSEMKLPQHHRLAFSEKHDLRKPMRDIEFWANNVEARRRHAIANYLIGQEQAGKRKKNDSLR